jgi:hypothetical protein
MAKRPQKKSKRLRCLYCKKPFTPPQRGRPPIYCCAAHRQRAWVACQRYEQMPRLLFGKDLDDYRTKAGIDRAVRDALRKYGFMPAEQRKPPPLRLVLEDEGKGDEDKQ